MIAAFLYAQLENIDQIQNRRLSIWNRYHEVLKKYKESAIITLPVIPEFASNNAHIFYLLFSSLEQRSSFIRKMKENGCASVFHYLSLHKSEYYRSHHDGREMVHADRYMDTLVRLPFYYELQGNSFDYLLEKIEAVLGSFY